MTQQIYNHEIHRWNYWAQKDKCIDVITAYYNEAKIKKQLLNAPLTEEWSKEDVVHIAMEYYWTIKRMK